MFDDAILPDDEGRPAPNRLIVERLGEDLTDENFAKQIERELHRQAAHETVRLSDEPAPDRPAPGQPDIPGVHFYVDNQNTFEDILAGFYGLGYSNEGEAAATELEDRRKIEKGRAVSSYKTRIEAIGLALKGVESDVIKTEMEPRLRQLRAELAQLESSIIRRRTSIADFVVTLAKKHAVEAGIVEIRDLHICAKKAQHVKVHWGFVLIDLSKYEARP